MAKQLNVNLAFTADTGQAQQALKQLQQDLNKISSTPLSLIDDAEMKQAAKAADDLKMHLQNAVNVNTGKLDLNRLSTSLNQADQKLSQFASHLKGAGLDGEKAFLSLSKSIALAEAPTTRLNNCLSTMLTTLKNTARWQISSSILHGFLGTLQSAYHYAEDLNGSLNNIRIVTGASVEEMDRFAQRANKAAKELSTTTTAYTDAALIFYQQGIRDNKEIEERTNAVIKMSNVTGDSAEEVSSYMTAIWNNFDDGSESLEHYADVITALGASTASSSAEISAGLEKFASIGKTIGLSYDYATSALATIVANTRQSADSVGTGLRTIFSRLQGLSLGETLEDGVDLNKYSKALKTVGVDVLDTTGNMRQMDDILNDLADKWETLSEAQQTALAQTVGGVRQYTTLISLMNNWDDMEQNLETAQGADGSLQEQADIYAESWEAAQKRVKAAAQEIYSSLLDDKFFISITSGFAKFLGLIGDIVQGMGGMKGTLLFIGSLFSRYFAKEAPAAISNLVANFQVLTGKAHEAAIALKEENQQALAGFTSDSMNNALNAEITGLEKVNQMTITLGQSEQFLSKAEQEAYRAKIEKVKAITEAISAEGKELDSIEKQTDALERQFLQQTKLRQAKKDGSTPTGSNLNVNTGAMKDVQKNVSSVKQLIGLQARLETQNKNLAHQSTAWKNTDVKDSAKMTAAVQQYVQQYKALEQEFNKAGIATKDMSTAIAQLEQDLKAANGDTDKIQVAFDKFGVAMQGDTQAAQDLDAKIAALEQELRKLGVDNEALMELENQFKTGAISAEEYRLKLEQLSQEVSEAPQHTLKYSESFAALAGKMMSVGMLITQIKNLGNIWSNEDLSTGEKLVQTITAVGFGLTALLGIMNKETVQQLAGAAAAISHALGLSTEAAATEIATGATVSFTTALYTLLWPIGLAIVAIGLLVAAVAGLIALFNQPTEAEKNLEEATEAAKHAKEAYNDAKTAAQELNSAFDQYDSVLETFEQCTIGTQEWRDAMSELNEQVIALLETYPELRQYLQTGEHGELTISQEGLDSVRQTQNQRANAALMSSTMAGIEQANAQVEVDREAVSNALSGAGLVYDSDINHAFLNVLDQLSGTEANRESDAALVANALEESMRATAAQEAEELYGLKEGDEGYAEKVNELLYNADPWLFDQDGNRVEEEWADQLEIISDTLENSNVATAIRNYASSVQAADTQASSAITALTASMLSDRDDLSEAEKSLAGKYVQDDAAIIEEQLRQQEYDNHSKTTDSDDLAVETWRRYQAASGHNNWRLQSNAIQGDDNNRQYGYIDENGDEQTIDFDDMASIIAAYEALDRVGVAADKAAATLAHLDESVPDAADGLRGFLTSGNLNDMSANAFANMQEQLVLDSNGNASEASIDDYLMNAFGISDKSELIAILGENYNAQFNEAQKLYADSLQKFTDSIPAGVQQAFASIDSDDMSLTGKQAVLDMLERAMIEGGASARDKVAKVLQDLPDDKVDNFSSALANINWDTAKVDDIKGALDAAGVSTKDLNIDFLGLIDAMKSTETVGLKSVQETFKQVADIAKGMSVGDTINAEDYATLVDEYGKSFVDGYFSVMADGTHRLIGDAEDFYSLVVEQQRNKMLNNIEQNANLNNSFQNTTVQTLNSGDFSTGDQATAAIEYLKTLELTDEELIALRAAQEEYNNIQTYSTDTYTMLNSMMQEHKITEEQFTVLVEQNSQAIRDNSEAILSSATSLAELDGLTAQVAEASGGVVYGYAEALISLASQYDNCTNEVEEYQKALSYGNEETIAAAEDSLRAAATIGELAKKYDLIAEDVETQAKLLQENRKELNLTKEQAARLAVANQRMNRGVKTLNENFSDWKKILTSTDHTTQDYAETLNDAYDALADLTGAVDAASIPLDFLDNTTEDGSKHLQWLEKAAKGDVQAINLLGSALAIASVKAMEMDNSFTQAFADITGVGIDQAQNKFLELQGKVSSAMQQIHDAIQSGLSVDEIQAKINGMDASWITALNEMAVATGMSVDQMNALLGQLGVQAKVEVQNVRQRMQVPMYVEKVESTPVTTYDTVVLADGSTKQVPVTKNEWAHYTVPAGFKDVEGVVQVAQISTDENPMTPVVSYTGTGGASTGGGVSPSSTPSRGGGGGGGSSSPPKYNEEKHKNTSDEKERYHVIKNQLEDLTSQYDRISKAKDRAFGSARLANLNKEIEAQKKLNNANKKYLEEIESYLGTDKAVMAGYGAQFDANGTITNYDALIQNAVNEYNAAVEAFNQTYTDDEGAKEAMEAAEKRYDQFMKDLKQYEETQDLYKDQLQQTIDDANALRDLLLERTQLQVELKVDVAEDSLKLLEQLFDNIENKAYDAAEAFGYLNQMTGSYFDQLNAYNSGLQSLFANQGLSEVDFNKFVNGDTATFNRLVDMLSDGESAGFSAEDISTIREYIDGLLEANENLREIRQTVHEQILTVWEEWGEKIDAGISKIEHLQAITESYQNIIDIVGQKNLGVSDAFMSRMRQQSIDQANDKLVAEKARYDELRKARDAAYAKFEEQKAKGILSPEEIKTWEDSLAQMDEDVNSASEDFQSAWEDALNGINEAFEAEVQQIVDAYSDAAAGLLSSISELQEAFDRRSDLASQYLEDYEKIYQFNKLNRDIEKSVDETNNVRAKKELLELQSKITALQEAGVDISKYEMEQLRQEYELKKAQIELEEAQDSKSQVQMQRDSDGNYSYVYTANTDDVANAEANYADKLHDMQVSNAEYIQDLQSNMVQMEQDYQDKVQEIMSDTSLSAEERMAKLNEVNQYYDEKMKFYISEAQLWEQNSQRLYEQDWTNYATMTGYKISEEDKWLDHWNETQLSLLTGFDTLEEYQSNHNINVANLLLESGVAFATWQTNIETAMNNAGTSIGTFEKDATEELQTVAEESDKLKDSIVNMSTDAHQAVRSIVEEVGNWENSYSKTVQNMLTKNTALITSFNQLLAAWSKVEAATPNNNSDSENNGSSSGNGSSGSSSGNNGSNSGSGGGSSDNSAKAEGVAAAIWMDGGVSGWGNGSSRSAKLAEKGVAAAQAYINAHGPNGDIYRDWVNKRGQLKQYYYGAFDTGGYTGAWGAEGKFAMLHEKELVLNKDDTTNFLQAIDIIRQISDTIDLNALSSSGGLSSLFAATASSSAQTLQQEVTIHAEFPNATDRDEISAAFSDLVNLASQYANRK